MATWSLQHIINHHKGIEALDPMFLKLQGMISHVHGDTRLGLACCEAIEKSGRALTVKLLSETMTLNNREEYRHFVSIPAHSIGRIQLPELTASEQAHNLGVTVENGKVIVSSLDVARVFDKLHCNVLRDIKILDCSEKFRLLNFEESSYKNEQNRLQPCYKLTRDGFAFLCMGYTGKKAAVFKEAYIKRFNDMEKALTGPVIAPLALPAPLPLRCLVTPQPTGKLYTSTEAAEQLKIGGHTRFYTLMVRKGFFTRSNRKYVPKSQYVKQGFFVRSEINGRKCLLVTQKGMVHLMNELKTA